MLLCKSNDMTYKQFVNETTIIKGDLQKYEKILYENYLKFLQNYYKTNINLSLVFRKSKPNSKNFGYVDLIKLKNKNYKIIIEDLPLLNLENITHEFIHIVQFIKKDLDLSNDYKYILWKKKNYMTVAEYNEIEDYSFYITIPWEQEAYVLQKKLPIIYYNSFFYEKLKKTKTYKEYLEQEAIIDKYLEKNNNNEL